MSRHLDLETLSALLDSELGAAAASAAQAHLAECGECRERLEGLRATVSQLRSLPAASPPPHVREALRRQLAIEQDTRRRLWALPGWHPRLATWPATAAAVVLAFGCGVFLYAYLVRHPSLQPSVPTIAPEGEWRATITYERASGVDEVPPAAAAEPPPSASEPGSPKATAENKLALHKEQPPAPAAVAPYAPAPASPDVSADAELVQRRDAAAEVTGQLAAHSEREEAVQVTAESAAEPRASGPGAAAPALRPKPAPAPAVREARRRMAERDEPSAGDHQVLKLEPGMTPPVRIAGANPDLDSLRGVRLRQTLILIEGTIEVDGALRDVSIRPQDLDPRLAGLLRRTIATWKFEPARKNGEPVAVRYVVTVNIDVQ